MISKMDYRLMKALISIETVREIPENATAEDVYKKVESLYKTYDTAFGAIENIVGENEDELYKNPDLDES